MNRSTVSLASLALTAALATTLAGCASSSNRVTVQQAPKISKGQELSDLVRARDANAVTSSEYEELRRIIMNRPQ